jgi:diguanylate cyclase (GGDEF)-like protein/PAS domain S-box-containing protein
MVPKQRSDTTGPACELDTLDDGSLDAFLATLLSADPAPIVLAYRETGLCVPVPAEVPIAPWQRAKGVVSALELCIPADLPFVVAAWDRVRERRIAQVSVHPLEHPEQNVTLHLVDARHRYGVYLGILSGLPASIGGPTAQRPVLRAKVCTLERDQFSAVRALSPTVTEILGWTADDLIGKRTLDLTHPDDRRAAVSSWLETLTRPGNGPRSLTRYRDRDGQYIWFEVTHANLLADPARACVVSEMVDVSERMAAVEALRASEKLLRRVTESLPLGIIQIDAGRRIVYRNERLLRILGQTDAATLDDAFLRVAAPDRGRIDAALSEILGGGEPPDLELTIDHPGGPRRCSITLRGLGPPDGAATGAIVSVTDVTERSRLREELERRAHHDDLTHCHNRASILEILERAMHSPRAGGGVAVVFVDLDRFKQINDRHGHAAGDTLLQLTGQRLMHCVRGDDIVGRLGGDEFLVVCPNLDTPELALALAQRIAAALAEPATLGAIAIVPSASIGVAWTKSALDADTIVARADEAMYKSKRRHAGPVLIAR